jgi:hypothetical protein
MNDVAQDKTAPETKSAGTSVRPEASDNKFALARRANKLRKKKAHLRTLRRSNTKG